MNELLPNEKLPIGDWEEFVLDIASRKLDRAGTRAFCAALLNASKWA